MMVLLALGLLAGILGGMLGIGGGSIMVPMLILAFGFGIHVAIGTSLAVMIAIAAAGALAHYMVGNVDLGAVSIMIVGAILGAIVGARIAEAVPAPLLTRIFGIALLAISIKMILS